MTIRIEAGEKIRQYFLEVEKEYKAITGKPLSHLDLFATQLKLAQ